MLTNENNRAFQNMRKDALEMLAGKDPQEIAAKAGVAYDAEKREFYMPSLGSCYTFRYPDYEETTEMDPWYHLTVLHYLNLADGTPNAEEACAFGDLPDGMIRGGKFAQTASNALCQFVRTHTEESIREILQKLGGEIINGKADLSVRLPYLPHYPIYINIWFADEEFPPSAKMLVDRNSWHNLSIEDAVTVGEYILRILTC